MAVRDQVQAQDDDQVVVDDNGHQVEVVGQADVVVTATGGKLHPFRKGDPRAAEYGRKGGEARRARAAAGASSAREVAKRLLEVRQTFSRESLGPDAAAAASWLVGQVVAGKIPVRSGDEAATLLRALVEVARLEAGESTSNTLVAHVGAGAAAEVRALRDQARQALGMAASSSAVAAVDTPPVDPAG